MVSAAETTRVIRAHRGIENGLHWSLDVVMQENQAAQNPKEHPETGISYLNSTVTFICDSPVSFFSVFFGCVPSLMIVIMTG